MTRFLWPAALVAAFVTLVVVPAIVVATFDSTALPHQLEVGAGESVGDVSVSELLESGSVMLTTEWEAQELLVAPMWAGLVTDVLMQPGDPVTDGGEVARINGILRLSVQAPAPWYRQIGIDSDGVDVSYLRQALVRLGYIADSRTAPSTTWDDALRGAVNDLAAELGVPPGPERDVFDPGWFVWIAPERTGERAQTVLLRAGEPAPSQGATVATSVPTLVDVAAASTTLQLEGATTWTIRRDDGTILVESAHFDGPQAADDTIETLQSILEPPVGDSHPVIEVPVQFAAPSGRRVARVPPAAWIRDVEGGGCVWTRPSPQQDWAPVLFDGYDSTLGIGATEDPRFLAELRGHQVLLNANDILEDATCPSLN